MLNVNQNTSLGFVRMRATSTNIVAWKVFHTITKTGSLSRAAIELDLSVSKLSRLLAQLEDDLGETLIDRSRHPLRPTAFGQKVLAKLKTVLPLWCEFEDFLNAEKGLHHVVRLSTPVGIGRFYLNKQLAEYHKLAPHIVIEASIEQGVEALLNHEVDVVFLIDRTILCSKFIRPCTPSLCRWLLRSICGVSELLLLPRTLFDIRWYSRPVKTIRRTHTFCFAGS